MENIIALKRKLETRVLEVLDQIFENTPMIAEIFYLSTAYNEEGTFSSISKSYTINRMPPAFFMLSLEIQICMDNGRNFIIYSIDVGDEELEYQSFDLENGLTIEDFVQMFDKELKKYIPRQQ